MYRSLEAPVKLLYDFFDYLPVIVMAVFTVLFIAICIVGGEVNIRIGGRK